MDRSECTKASRGCNKLAVKTAATLCKVALRRLVDYGEVEEVHAVDFAGVAATSVAGEWGKKMNPIPALMQRRKVEIYDIRLIYLDIHHGDLLPFSLRAERSL